MSVIGVSNGELYAAMRSHGRVYDMIVLDACNTGSLELIGEIRPFARYVLASPHLFPAHGFPWINILPNWKNKYHSLEIGRLMGEQLLNAYRIGGIYNTDPVHDRMVSMTITDLSQYEKLLSAIMDFSITFGNADYSDYFLSVRSQTYDYNYTTDIDFYDFVTHIYESNSFDSHKNAIIQNLKDKLNLFVAEKYSLSFPIEHSISIFFPNEPQNFFGGFDLYWANLQFAHSGWSRFMNYVYGTDIISPHRVKTINHIVNLETIYIDWIEPIDPVPLKYQIDFYDTNDVLVRSENVVTNSYKQKITTDGYFYLTAIDEVGNRSETTRSDFFVKHISRNHLYIVPNPVSANHSTFTIHYFLTEQSSVVDISIYDISGRKVWTEHSKDITPGEHNITLNTFATGVYFVVLISDAGSKRNKFAIIR
jgi:hypothetical protein